MCYGQKAFRWCLKKALMLAMNMMTYMNRDHSD